MTSPWNIENKYTALDVTVSWHIEDNTNFGFNNSPYRTRPHSCNNCLLMFLGQFIYACSLDIYDLSRFLRGIFERADLCPASKRCISINSIHGVREKKIDWRKNICPKVVKLPELPFFPDPLSNFFSLYPKIPVEGDTRSLKFQTCIHSNTVL